MPTHSAAEFLPSDTLLVLDLLHQAWVGPWRSDAFRMRLFAPYYEGEEERVAILGSTGEASALFPPGGGTSIDKPGKPIVSEVRATLLGSIQQKDPGEVVAEVETLGTLHRFAYEADGVKEGREVLRREPDNTRRKRVTDPVVDLTNAADDLQDSLREDYSFDLPAAGADLHELTGWVLGASQRSHETMAIPQRFRAVTVGVAANRGRLAVRQLAVYAPGLPPGRGSQL